MTTKTTRRASQAAQRLQAARLASALFEVVGQPIRLELVLLLEQGEPHVAAIAEAMGLSHSAASHHLARLRIAGAVDGRYDASRRYYALTDRGRVLAALARRLVSLSTPPAPTRRGASRKAPR